MTGGFKQAEISLETHTQRLTGLTEIKLFSWLLLRAWKIVLWTAVYMCVCVCKHADFG